MGRRITLRRIGADTGKKAALPATMPDLLEVATTKLQLAAPAKRIFSADGDEYDADDLDLIETDDVLYVSCGEYFVPHAASIEQPPASSGAIVRVWRSMTRQCAPRNASASLLLLQYITSTLVLRPDARVRCVIRHPFRVYGSVRIVIVIKCLLNQSSHSQGCGSNVRTVLEQQCLTPLSGSPTLCLTPLSPGVRTLRLTVPLKSRLNGV